MRGGGGSFSDSTFSFLFFISWVLLFELSWGTESRAGWACVGWIFLPRWGWGMGFGLGVREQYESSSRLFYDQGAITSLVISGFLELGVAWFVNCGFEGKGFTFATGEIRGGWGIRVDSCLRLGTVRSFRYLVLTWAIEGAERVGGEDGSYISRKGEVDGPHG